MVEVEQRDCSQLVESLYGLDRHWDEFLIFTRNDRQNLDHIQFTKDGKPMTGYFRSHRVLAHEFVNGRWFQTRQCV